jgi:hypothetical protein
MVEQSGIVVVQTQEPLSHDSPLAQLPQLNMSPQVSVAVPQVMLPQAWAFVSAVQHLFPLHSSPLVHELVQVMVSPQLFLTVPHATFWQGVTLSGVQHWLFRHSWVPVHMLVQVSG